jgi:WD40 repeat protein
VPYFFQPEIQAVDLTTGGVSARLRTEGESTFRHAALSPRGNLLAGVGERKLYVWDFATQKLLQTLDPDLGPCHCVAFSPHGRFLACGCEEGTAVFDTGEFQRQLTVAGEVVRSIGFGPNEKHFAYTCAQQDSTPLWNLVTRKSTVNLAAADILAFSSGRSVLATATHESVSVWNLERTPEKMSLLGHSRGVPGLAFSPDGAILASTSKDKTVRIWNAKTGQLIRTLSGFEDEAQPIAFSPDGRLLAAADWGGVIIIWKLRTWEVYAALLPHEHQLGGLWSLAFDPKGDYFAASGDGDPRASGEGGIAVWRLDDLSGRPADDAEHSSVPTLRLRCGDTRTVRFSPVGQLIAAIAAENSVRIWNLATAEELWAPPAKAKYNGLNLVFYPDGKHLGYNTTDGTFTVWELEARRKAFSLFDEGDYGRQASLSPDGRLLARDLARSTKISIWDALHREQLITLPPQRASMWSSCWAPDSRRLAIGYSDGEIVIWDITNLRNELEGIGLDWP